MAVTRAKETLNDGVISAERFEKQVLTSAGATTYLDNTLVALDSSTLKLVPYVKGGVTNGNGEVYGVVLEGFAAAGAGDTPVSAMIVGAMVTSKCVIHADGDSSNIDAAVKKLCKAQGIVLVDAVDHYVADNS